MRARVGVLGLLALLAVGGAACDRASSAGERGILERAADDDWRGKRLADFRLSERGGGTVTRADLAGAPFVIDFVFTRCAGPCPLMSAGMAELQAELAGSGVRLVSVSVDPLNDTLEVLSEYADNLGADPERWLFLRGDEAQLGPLMASVDLAVQRDDGAEPGYRVTHSTRFLVVDGEGWVRGYYPGTTPEGRARTAARARWLAGR